MASASEEQTSTQYEERLVTVERVHAREEAAMSELHGRLLAARLEVEAAAQRSEELSRAASSARDAADDARRELGEARNTSFHNHCLLAKVLLNTKQRPANVLPSELWEEINGKAVPLNEWPNWVVMRMSGGEPLSAWL